MIYSKKRLPLIFLIFFTIILFVVVMILQKNSNKTNDDKTGKIKIEKPQGEFGITTDSLIVFKGKIKPNQNLSEILLKYGVDYSKIDLLAKRSKPIFDIRKIRAGNNYTILCAKDSTRKAKYFIYESSAVSYVVFDLGDSVHIHKGEKEIETRIKTISGTINTSLWNDMLENKTNPVLALDLSDVYQWTIDFFGLQKGDKYKIIYEDLYVEDESVGLGKIIASWFYHAEKEFYGFYFVQDSIGDYFDDKANSLKKQFLKAPLRFSRISSGFSNSRRHPILKIRRPHHGVDYAAPRGTPVQALGDGKVTEVHYKGGYGKYVKIRHNSVYTTGYAHLSKYGKGIKAGVYVNQGEIIGYVGSTGMSTGPHLDFRVYKNGQAINPLKMESPPSKPVDSVNIERYNLLMKKRSKELENIKFKNL